MYFIIIFFAKVAGASMITAIPVGVVLGLLSVLFDSSAFDNICNAIINGASRVVPTFWFVFFSVKYFKNIFKPRNQRILELKQKNFDAMTGPEFENFCATLLAYNGYSEIHTTPGTSDHGIDILAKKDGNLYAIQCKRYDKNVGNKAVQEAYSGKTIYKADYSVVMTNSNFTKQAVQDAATLNVILWDRSVIKKYLSVDLS